MIRVDTSVRVEHLRRGRMAVQHALDAGVVVAHPFVAAAIALFDLPPRNDALALSAALPQAPGSSHANMLAFIQLHRLTRLGIGLVENHVLAAAALRATALRTRDKRRAAAAATMGRLHHERRGLR